MDFLDPVKKRAHKRRLFIGYFLIGVALLLGSIILLMQVYGYDLDRKTRQVIQNGLIFVDSNPEKSTIYLNGKENGQTDKRLTVPAGKYDLELKRDGYRSWKKSFDLEGSSIERLSYPILFPEKLDSIAINTNIYDPAPVFVTQSPDRHWLLVARSINSFEVVNANDPKASIPGIQFPKDVLTAKPANASEGLEVLEWSNDNRHLLIKHTFADKYEYVMLDREEPATSFNVTNTLGANPAKITMRDKKFDQLYLYDANGSLRIADTKTKQITNYLTGVINYKSYSDNVMLYAMTDPADPNKVVVKMREDAKEYTLRSGLKTDQYILDIARYGDHWYLAIATAGKVLIYRDPNLNASTRESPSLFTSMILANPSQVLFSTNTRFIMAQSGSKFAIYDAETNRRSYFELELKIDQAYKAKWMDAYHIVLNNDKKVVVVDYDGANLQKLVDIAPDGVAYFDRDYTRLYNLFDTSTVSKKSYSINRTNLKLNLQ